MKSFLFRIKGSLETKEYMIPELHKTLQLSQDQVSVLAALLGNFLLPESELQDLYRRIIPNNREAGEVIKNYISKISSKNYK